MARSSDPKKLALWPGRFRRFLDSGLTVARFCAIEHASESSFYFWQKKLGPQTRRRSARAEDHSTFAEHHGAHASGRGLRAEYGSVRTEDHGTYAEHHGARAEDRSDGAQDRGVYAEDHDTRTADLGTRAQDRGVGAEDRDVCSENHSVRAEDHGVFRPVTVVPATCGVVIRLPGGTRIEVDAHHLDAIRAVVAETVRVDQNQTAERNASSDNPVTQKASSDNPVGRDVPSDNQVTQKASSDNQVTRNVHSDNQVNRTVSFGNEVTRNASSDNQVTRKASSGNQVMRKRGTIGKRDGSTRTSGTVSC